MSRSETLQCIVLKTYDVGEADRWCILFSRECGRLAARARGVRKLTSRMGGALLPLQQATLTLHRGRGSNLITAAQGTEKGPSGFAAVSQAQYGVSLLLKLLHDEEPLPDVYDLTEAYLHQCGEQTGNTLRFLIQLLNRLGLLPHANDLRLSDHGRLFITATTNGEWLSPLPDVREQTQIVRLCQSVMADQITHPLPTEALIS